MATVVEIEVRAIVADTVFVNSNPSTESFSSRLSICDSMPSRPLNAFERFFCDEPSRPFGEAKLLSVVASLTISAMAQSAPCDEQAAEARLKEAATAAWISTAKHLPYLRCRIEYADGAPHLVEVGQEEFVAKLPELAAVHVVQAACGSTAEALEHIRGVPFDETAVLATVALAVTSWERGDVALMVTMSHIGADARSAFSVARLFIQDLGQWLADGTTPDREPGRLVDLIEALGIERIVRNPLRPPIVPDGMPPLVPPVAPDIPRQGLEQRVTLRSAIATVPAPVLSTLLRLAKVYGITIQSIFSAAGSLATLRRADPATREALASSPDRSLTFGCQMFVELRNFVRPQLPKNSFLLGPSVIWVYVPVGARSTLLDVAQALTKEVHTALNDGRVLGFFKMYLAPPLPPGGSNVTSDRTTQVGQDAARQRTTYGFTNIGLHECSTLDGPLSSPSSGGIVVHDLDMEHRLCARMQPPIAYLRMHGYTTQGAYRVCVMFTEPCFGRATAEAFLRDCIQLASSFVDLPEECPATSAVPLSPAGIVTTPFAELDVLCATN